MVEERIYLNQPQKTPVQSMEYITKEIPLASLVLRVFMACGKKAEVVRKAARYPIIKCLYNNIINPFKLIYYIAIS